MKYHVPPSNWYENQDGDEWYPSEREPLFTIQPPEGYIYHRFRIVGEMREPIFKLKPDGSGSTEIAVGTCGYAKDLVLASVRPSMWERLRAFVRRPFRPPTRYRNMHDATLVSAVSCERCMNARAWENGLAWGYAHHSDKWWECGTQCELCNDEPLQRPLPKKVKPLALVA